MKKTLLSLLLFFLLISCSTLRETRSLSRCEFRYDRIVDLQMAGIALETINGYGDLSMIELGKLSAAVLSGELPLQMTLILEARNPNKRQAALNRLEYILYFDEAEMSRGSVDQRIVIPPGATVSIPVTVNLNLLDILDPSGLRSIVKLALSLSDRTGQTSKLTIRVRPSLMIAGKPVYYPGYIRINREFGTGGN